MGKRTNHLQSHTGESSNFRFDRMIPVEMMKYFRSKVYRDKMGKLVIKNKKIKTVQANRNIGYKDIKKFYTKKRRSYIKRDIRQYIQEI